MYNYTYNSTLTYYWQRTLQCSGCTYRVAAS